MILNRGTPARRLEETSVEEFRRSPEQFVRSYNDLVRHVRRSQSAFARFDKADGTYIIIGNQPGNGSGNIVLYNNDGTVNTVIG